MSKIIVSPVYGVSKELLDDVKTHQIVIITDSVSPIFPIDRREYWLEMTKVMHWLHLDSIPNNEDDEDFIEVVKAKANQISAELKLAGEVELVVYVSDDRKFEGVETKQYANPLTMKYDDLDEPFRTRFSDEFLRFTTPKEEQVVEKYERVALVPYYVHMDKKYYGYLITYPWGQPELLKENFLKATLPSELKVLAKTFVHKIFDVQPNKVTFLGSVDDVMVVAVECAMPWWIKSEEILNWNKKDVATNAVAVFLPEDLFYMGRLLYSIGLLIL